MPEMVTIDQIRGLIKEEKIKPSDLFGAETLAEDPSVKGLIETEKRQAVAGEYAHRKRTEEGFDKTKGELEKKILEGQTEIQKLKLEAAKTQVGGIFEKQKGERKLDEKQAKFIQLRLERFRPEKIEDLEKDFNKYLDVEIDEYKRISKEVYGIDAEQKEEQKSGGTEADEKKQSDIENKYLDPTKNPFIKTD